MANNFTISGVNKTSGLTVTKNLLNDYGVKTMSVDGLWGDMQFKDYFKRDWIDNDGIDYYLDPVSLKTKESKVVLEGLCKGVAAKTNVKNLFEFIMTHAPLTLKDVNYWAIGAVVIPEKTSIVSAVHRSTYDLIQFKIEFTNPSGKTVAV